MLSAPDVRKPKTIGAILRRRSSFRYSTRSFTSRRNKCLLIRERRNNNETRCDGKTNENNENVYCGFLRKVPLYLVPFNSRGLFNGKIEYTFVLNLRDSYKQCVMYSFNSGPTCSTFWKAHTKKKKNNNRSTDRV